MDHRPKAEGADILPPLGRCRPYSRRRYWGVSALGCISGVAILVGIIGWVGSERAIHPQPKHYVQSLADYPDLRPESIGFTSRNHTRIAGSFFPGTRPTTLVLSHGYGEDREQMLPYVEFLHRAGFTVLTYDMRSRGKSGGDAVTLGALETSDLISAIDYLTARDDVDHGRIGAMGVSLGAAATILAAAEDRRIKAVVDDSGFSDARSVIGSSFEHFIGLPAFPFASITVAIAEWRTGVNLNRVRPVDVVGRIGPRPLFIIHCKGDTVVPPDQIERVFESANQPKEIWWVPTGGHIDGYKVARVEYERRVSEFFIGWLRQ